MVMVQHNLRSGKRRRTDRPIGLLARSLVRIPDDALIGLSWIGGRSSEQPVCKARATQSVLNEGKGCIIIIIGRTSLYGFLVWVQ